MKIRTFTCFITLGRDDSNELIAEKINRAAEVNKYLKQYVETRGIEVQTTRVSTNCLEEYCDCDDEERTIERIRYISSCVSSTNRLDSLFVMIRRKHSIFQYRIDKNGLWDEIDSKITEDEPLLCSLLFH